jgi:hypothetical protein
LSSSVLFESVKSKIYKTVILPVPCGCEIWSFMLRGKHRTMLRRTLGVMNEVTGSWRKLHNEPHNLYVSPNTGAIKSRRMR